jgi:hypothetical protein
LLDAEIGTRDIPALAGDGRKGPVQHVKKILIIVIVIGAAAYFGMDFFLGSIVREGVNSFGPKLTGTRVVLGSARLSPLTGHGSLRNLVVGNPPGWSDNNAFALGHVRIKVEPFSIFRDHIVIEEIDIDGPEFNYETKLVSSNIKDLLNSIERFSGGKDGANTPTTKDGQPIKFVVRKFRITHGVARIGVGAAGLPIPLPPISIDDLGVSQGGITPDQLVGTMMSNVLVGIVSGSAEALGKLGATAGATAAEKSKEAAKAATEGLKKIFDRH